MIWQTKKWQNMLKKSNQVEKNICLDLKGKDIFIEKRKISLGETALFVLGVSPMDFTKEIEEKLVSICKEEKSLFLQVETFSYDENIVLNSKYFKDGYFKNFITSYTAIIYLEKTEDEILASMKPKGRYNIRLATKKGVTVKEVEKTSENIQIFTNLIIETAKRDNFMMNSSFDYYKSFLKKLDFSRLIFAFFEGEVISAGIFTYDDNIAIYYYGASSSSKKFRNLMAPYLVQREAIKLAMQNNCKIYDFLGVSDPNNKNDSLNGVTNFKLKFTKEVKNVSKNYIFVNKKFKYFFMNILRKLQKKFL